MSERSFGENIRAHKKAELGGAAAGAAIGISFYFGRRALAHRREQMKKHGESLEPSLDKKTYEKLMGVFRDTAIDSGVRATMAAAAAQLYVETKHKPDRVLTPDDFIRNRRVNTEFLPEALGHLQELIGVRPNPSYMGGEGAEEGYYAKSLEYGGVSGIEFKVAPLYAREVKDYLDYQDRLNNMIFRNNRQQ